MNLVVLLAVIAYAAAAPPYNCEYGPSYWCSNLNIAKACGAVDHCMDTIWKNQDLSNIKETDACTYCEEFIGDIQKQFNNKTETQMKAYMDEACSIIPDTDIANECRQQVDSNLPEIFAMIRQSLDPKTVCSAMGLCQGFQDLAAHIKAQQDMPKVLTKENGNVCSDCEAFIKDCLDVIDSNTTQDEIEEFLHETCDYDGIFKKQCNEIVDEFTPQILKELRGMTDAKTVCQAYGLCNGDKTTLQKLRTMIRRTKLASKSKKNKLAAGDICADCKVLIQDLADMIDSTTTEAQLEKILNEMYCSYLGGYKEECEKLVDQYTAELLNMLAGSVDPDLVCQAFMVCPGDKYILQKMRLGKYKLSSIVDQSKDNGNACTDCKAFIEDCLDLIDSNTTQAQIEEFLHEMCEYDGIFKKQCNEIVDEYTPQILKELRGMTDVDTVCQAYRLCNGDKTTLQKLRTMIQKTKLASKSKKSKLAAGDICADCKALIQDLSDMIDSNTTESDLSSVIKEQVCAELGGFASECDTLVDTYLPEILETVKDNVDPDVVCQAFMVCPGDKHILQKMRLKKSKLSFKIKNDEFCTLCETAMTEVQTMLRDTTVQSDVENFIKKNICSKMGSLQQECESDVDEYGPIIFQLVTSELDPKSICSTLSLCSQTKKQLFLKNARASAECVLCEFIMKEISDQLSNNATEEEIIQVVDKVCGLLPDTISQQCTNLIDTYGKAIIILLKEELDPQTVCTTLGLCQGKVAAKHVKPPVKTNDGELCGVCETIIQYLDSLLDENSTVIEIESALKKVCNFVPDTFKSECNDFINEYGNKIIGMIVEEASPKEICTELKLCDTALRFLPVLEPVVIPQKEQMVGMNECTYGPSYWCQSYDNAKKCKATKHCISHVWKNGVPRL